MTVSGIVDALVADYGRSIGLPHLAFDDDNLIGLAFDDTQITLVRDPESSWVIIKSPLEIGRGAIEPGFMYNLSAANTLAFRAGVGIVEVDASYGVLVWMHRIDLRGMSVAELDVALRRATRDIADWRLRLPGLRADSASDTPVSDVPMTDVTADMIRV